MSFAAFDAVDFFFQKSAFLFLFTLLSFSSIECPVIGKVTKT
jgi:hypothetical protein